MQLILAHLTMTGQTNIEFDVTFPAMFVGSSHEPWRTFLIWIEGFGRIVQWSFQNCGTLRMTL